MRTTLLILVICIAFPFQNVGQVCQDAIHLTEYRMSIVGCCIREIKENNVVVYSLDGDVHEIEAIAINYRGTYYSLTNIESALKAMEAIGKIPKGEYMGHGYLYYSDLHSKASSKMFFGITLTAIGAGMMIGGVSVMGKNAREANLSENNFGVSGTGILLFLGGGASLGCGIPLTCIGARRKKEYKSIMREFEKNAYLSLKATNYGVGLVLNL